MDPEKIIKLVHNLREEYEHFIMNDKHNKFKSLSELEEYVEQNSKYSVITKNYKSMLKIIFSDKYDKQRLEYMIRLASRVHKGEVEEKTASVAVGQVLVDQIVKPQLDSSKKL
jgi:hypothetical protein